MSTFGSGSPHDVTGRGTSSTGSSKGTASGSTGVNSPGTQSKNKVQNVNPLSQGAISRTPAGQLSAAQKAQQTLAEARRQRALQAPYVDAATTIVGMLPMPGMATALRLGNWMSKKSEDVLAANPAALRSIPNVPGGMYGQVNGMNYSNRADYPGHTTGSRTTTASTGTQVRPIITQQQVKVKKPAPVQTVLGSGKGPLGSPTNPMPI